MIENPPTDSTDLESDRRRAALDEFVDKEDEESTLVETEHKTLITQPPLPLHLSFENIILIPYRDRKEHLDYFIKDTVTLIEKYMPKSRVLVIEQKEGKLFNRGKLLNVGFAEYKDKCNYFITHDVDYKPNETSVRDIYCRDEIDILRIKSPHQCSLGGVAKMSHDAIFNINGFPNYIWGWGIEDRALYFRCLMKNIVVTENHACTMKRRDNHIHIFKHKRNHHHYIGEKKKISDRWKYNYISKLDENQKKALIMDSGLNNLEYQVIERKSLHQIVDLIKVEI